jgi:hypothetical protein
VDKPENDHILYGPHPGKESQKKYGEAFVLVRREFADKGITHPTGKTPGFLDRVQDIYSNLMGESYKPVYSSSLIEKTTTDPSPPRKGAVYTVEEMEKEEAIKSLPGKTYGGYTFSLAQMETIGGLSDEQRVKIGETMVAALAAKKRKYQIKQDLFMAVINWDSEFFVELAFADCFFLEKPLISAFYHEIEFETETEVYEYCNASRYLKKYPILKKEIIKDAME